MSSSIVTDNSSEPPMDPAEQCALGLECINRNDADAAEWFQMAAERGHREAQCHLGFMLANGKGVDKNEAEAVKWYREAVKQNYAHAQFALGMMLANGRGAAKNEAETVECYRKAAEHSTGT
mmetsp:Transcript_36854/g.80272  ORF Transcript_36854/g.80272 Transcript_36854/m.80272 type:complete len:122 (-) Transcript_36854:70-435(-)